MKNVISIDPGMTSGVVLADYGDMEPLRILGRYEVEGGDPGLRDWINLYLDESFDGWEIVCEKFTPLPRVFKLAELEPLRIEGTVATFAYIAGEPVHWQSNQSMLLAGTGHGGNTALQRASANKKAADNVLRRIGLWTLPSEVTYKDANDVNSAMKHLLAYMRSIGHAPTIEAYGL